MSQDNEANFGGERKNRRHTITLLHLPGRDLRITGTGLMGEIEGREWKRGEDVHAET